MIAPRPDLISASLDRRRRSLGMSYAVLARRSGVSEPTLKRLLGGSTSGVAFGTVAATARALGMSLELAERDPDELLREQARQKAERIARMVQGTSALESQAVDDLAYQRLVERSYHELLAGPRRRLWSE